MQRGRRKRWQRSREPCISPTTVASRIKISTPETCSSTPKDHRASSTSAWPRIAPGGSIPATRQQSAERLITCRPSKPGATPTASAAQPTSWLRRHSLFSADRQVALPRRQRIRGLATRSERSEIRPRRARASQDSPRVSSASVSRRYRTNRADRLATAAELADASSERRSAPLAIPVFLAVLFAISFSLAWGISSIPSKTNPNGRTTGSICARHPHLAPEYRIPPALEGTADQVRRLDPAPLRRRKGEGVSVYFVNAAGSLQLLKEFPAGDADREVFYPESGKAQKMEGAPARNCSWSWSDRHHPPPRYCNSLEFIRPRPITALAPSRGHPPDPHGCSIRRRATPRPE